VIEIGSRRRNQPAPPHAVFEAVTNPDRDPSRPWLKLLYDEQRPETVRAEPPFRLVWTSIWMKRPDAIIELDLPSDGGGGTDFRWTLYVDDPPPDSALTGHMCRRLNELFNRDLRFSFGQ
jgi:hypothetical protein